MKKTLENLLFTLANNATFSLISDDERNGIQILCEDSSIIKIYETLIPEELKILFIYSSQNKTIVVSEEKIMNFLDNAFLKIEEDEAYPLVKKFGQPVFDMLKYNSLQLLSGEKSEVFTICDEQPQPYNGFDLKVQNNLNQVSTIGIRHGQKISNINPLKVTFSGPIYSLKDEKTHYNFMHFLIPKHNIKNYPLIDFNLLNQRNDLEFIDDLLLSHKSSCFNYFKLQCDLEEKKQKIVKIKI